MEVTFFDPFTCPLIDINAVVTVSSPSLSSFISETQDF